jgi:uncharacterized membrane protein
MELTLIIVLLIVVFLQLRNQKKLLNDQFSDLQKHLDRVYSQLDLLKKKLDEREIGPFVVKDATSLSPEPILEPQVVETVVPPPVEIAAISSEAIETPEPSPIPELVEEIAEIGQRAEPIRPPAPPALSFWEKYPDLERFIGENLINKIGIIILVVGMGFFLKYAIDQNWINEIGRTCIGLVSGGILIGIGHKMRNEYRSFSSVLIGGGIAILYFAITIAYQQYQLFGQELAFIIMIMITAATIVLALLYDRIELAVFAILGGFCSPFLVSSGDGNYLVLFTYLLILNSGMLVLAFYKKWNLVNQICFVLTTVLFGGWLYSTLLAPNAKVPKPYWGALTFATLFYLIFFLMNIVNNVRKQVNFGVFEILQLLSNTAFYFTWGMLILTPINNGIYRGTFTLFLAAVNFGFAFTLFKNSKIDRNLFYLLIGLVLTFISLAAPIQLEGNHITLFWALECVLVLWLAHKSGIGFLRDVSMLLVGLMIISLLMDWDNLYFSTPTLAESPRFPVFNKGFITSLMAVLGLVGYTYLLNRDHLHQNLLSISAQNYRKPLAVIIVLMTYAGIYLELDYQFKIHFPAARGLLIGCYNYLFVAGLILLVRNLGTPAKLVVLFCSVFLIVFHLPLYNAQTISIRNAYLEQHTVGLGAFLLHYILSALFILNIYFIHKYFTPLLKTFRLKPAFQWFVIVFVLGLLSAELDHLVVVSLFDGKQSVSELINTNHKAGFDILWGVISFVLIFLGMKWKSKNIRIASLALFAVTLLKLFLMDISGLSEGGKIAAFISLGVLLLIMSFLYQRLKTFLLVDDANSESAVHENN